MAEKMVTLGKSGDLHTKRQIFSYITKEDVAKKVMDVYAPKYACLLYTSEARLRRHRRVRGKISGTAERPRLDVFRSAKHIYAQVIDDEQGVTLALSLIHIW